ncbi:MAG: chromate efflux transporter [Gammaproteobacteria bacterium]
MPSRGPQSATAAGAEARDHGVSFGEAVRVWLRIAVLSFGGPAGQIALMHRILVEEKRWIGEERFLHALNYCMVLPGPEAQQLAIYIGWLLHKTRGGLVAGALFVLPGLVAIMALSWLYALFGNLPIIAGLFFGLKTAVLAIVLQAVVRIGSHALGNRVLVGIAAAAFVAIALLDVPFPLIILAAALTGYVGGRLAIPAFTVGGRHGLQTGKLVRDVESALGEDVPAHARVNLGWSLRISAVLLILWLAPVVALLLVLGPDDVFSRIATFFSQLAVVTFGGAYAVLAYVAQEAVETYQWVTPGEMLDGLGMAETTPGPLIMVTQFVGFMGAFRADTGLPPLIAGTLGGLLTTWVTFVPCFLWIFLGAPFIEGLRSNESLTAALTAITAAVVGVVMNLAIWFALHTLFGQVRQVALAGATFEVPVLASANLAAIVLTTAALIAVFRLRAGVVPVILGCAAAGLAFKLVV